MKTPEQKAEEYLKFIYDECFDDHCYAPDVAQSKKDFLAGYKAANEWISVEDEPKIEMWIIAKSELSGISPFYKSMFYVLENKTQLKLNYTYWKPIE